MKIIGNNPKKASWKLQQETLPNGKLRVISGYGGDGHFGYHKQVNPVSEIDNIIFTAKIQLTNFSRGRSSAVFNFNDKDGVHTYQTGCGGMTEIMRCVQASEIIVDGGWLYGKFTFAKQGSEIYLMPYDATE